jgi:hypothetical protein
MAKTFVVLFLIVAGVGLASVCRADDKPEKKAPPAPSPHRKIVFVCDGSASMTPKIAKLRKELGKAIDGLRAIQSFDMIFMGEKGPIQLDDHLLMATPDNKDRAKTFIDKFSPSGRTDPMPAMKAAFALKPTLIYLLCDHDFPDGEALRRFVRESNPHQEVKIDTIAFVGEKDTDTKFLEILKQIAEESGGVFKFVKEKDL